MIFCRFGHPKSYSFDRNAGHRWILPHKTEATTIVSVSRPAKAKTRTGADQSGCLGLQHRIPPRVVVKQLRDLQMMRLVSEKNSSIGHQRPKVLDASLQGPNQIYIAKSDCHLLL